MKLYTLEQEKKRHDNIMYANQNAKKYMRRHRVHKYIPGQVIYNLGEYPAKFTIKPTEYDYNRIKELSEMGVGLIQLHEEWNDAIRILGADKYTCHDKEGLKEFIKLCHDFNIKVIPYISTGFFEERDPDFKESFTRGKYSLNNSYYRYRMCDAGSPEWVNYLTEKVAAILDEYEFDGLFNDMGYDGDAIQREINGSDSLEGMPYSPFLEDLLVRFYSLCKERDGICKLHQNTSFSPPTIDKVYDYLWVGEAVNSTEDLLKTTQFNPYVIVAPDYRHLDLSNTDKVFAQALPFMQFILRPDGRPVTGIERISVPGVDYILKGERTFFHEVAEYNNEHPDGPYVYSEWSSIPDNVETREKWPVYLKLYQSMVEENSVCYIDITEGTLTANKPSSNIHYSLFVNDELYICMSNLGEKDETIVFNDEWTDRLTGERKKEFVLKPDKVYFLKK